jgi:small subunit ribosomal protein S25e
MDKTIQERLNKDVLTYRLITTAVLVDRLKINGSLARKALAELEQKGVIKKIVGHHKLNIYSMSPSHVLTTGFLVLRDRG